MDDRAKQVGARIQRVRKDQGISQTQLAEKINISVSHMSAIECGSSNFGVDILMRITEALKVSADSLLRTNIPSVTTIYGTEVDELLKDCSPAEIEAMLTTLRQIKSAFRQVHHDDN